MGKHNRSLVVAGLMAAAVAGTASAGGGDNGMNPFYGDSWAALQGGGVNLGGETVDARRQRRSRRHGHALSVAYDR